MLAKGMDLPPPPPPHPLLVVVLLTVHVELLTASPCWLACWHLFESKHWQCDLLTVCLYCRQQARSC